MATFVLTHGGFHGGWCWSRVAANLRSRGHEVFAPTLTGLGERSHLLSPSVNLSTHITDVVNVLRWENLTQVILCGHSYGGMVITGVEDLERARIRTMIYVDAFVPKNGDSLLDLIPESIASTLFMDAMRHGEGFRMSVSPASIYGIEAENDRAWVDSLLTPHPFATCCERLRLSNLSPSSVKKVFIYADGRHGTALEALRDKLASLPDWTLKTIQCGHDIMIDRPVELADILAEEATI